jgi:hypothetical protein
VPVFAPGGGTGYGRRRIPVRTGRDREGEALLPAPIAFRRHRAGIPLLARRRGAPGLGALLLIVPLALAGCGEGGLAGGLRAAGVAGKPDEFMVLPTKPLEMPQDLAALPAPALGTPNRVDYRPHQEAIAGLTGRPGAPGNADGTVLVAKAGPSAPQIRQTLAVEDVTWRETHNGRLLERLFSKDKRALVYRPMVLDDAAAFDAARAAGIGVPPAPPAVLE